MYLQLTRKNLKSAVICDDSWPRIEFNNTHWERVDSGTWYNISTGLVANELPDGNWLYNGQKFGSIKDLIVSGSE